MSPKTPSKLEKILSEGHLAVTSECGPPRGSDPAHIVEKGSLIKDHVDAINITDNQTAMTRMCSLAACIRLKLSGLEPVLQMVTRDRNRIALQSDILGAASFDINNILCLSGDHQSFGDCPNGQNVFEYHQVPFQILRCFDTFDVCRAFQKSRLHLPALHDPFVKYAHIAVFLFDITVDVGENRTQTIGAEFGAVAYLVLSQRLVQRGLILIEHHRAVFGIKIRAVVKDLRRLRLFNNLVRTSRKESKRQNRSHCYL